MKQRNQLIFIAMLLSLMISLLSGCNDERTIRVATEAADRQAEQNREMARVSREAAEATNRLIAEEGAARRQGHAVTEQRLDCGSAFYRNTFQKQKSRLAIGGLLDVTSGSG